MNIFLAHKDLRTIDNPALYNASLGGQYIVIYLYDQKYWTSHGYSLRQFSFANDCLKEMNDNLEKLNSKIHVYKGNLSSLTAWIESNYPNSQIYLNQSSDVMYFRKSLFELKRHFHEQNRINCYKNFGIQTSDYNRESWSKCWAKIMNSSLTELPQRNDYELKVPLPTYREFSEDIKKILPSDFRPQKGGEREAHNLLESFLNVRVAGYAKKMSNPLEAIDSCSRLSPHITHGSISLKFVYQNLINKIDEAKYKRDLYSFKKRLHWHCHFIQKLQTEPELEFKSMHPMCDNLRPDSNPELIQKWINGETGFPFLDACIIYLRNHGWINFRMRAMIMSFASYNLWQPWQKTSPLLAELFVDYEPGIHISQVQMQSGVTGINLPRIYSVTKQSIDQDPDAIFIKSQIPELKDMKPSSIHNLELLNSYKDPIVDIKETAKKARESIWSIRSNKDFKKIAQEVYLKHGSRFKKKAYRKSTQ